MIQTSNIDKLQQLLEEDKETVSLSERFGLPVVFNLEDFAFVKEKKSIIPYGFSKKHLVLPLEKKDGRVIVAFASPLDLETQEEVRYLLDDPIEEVICPRDKLEIAIERCNRQSEKEASQYIKGLDSEKTQASQEDEYDLLDQKSSEPVVRMLNVILIEAVQQDASDIHFEPGEEELVVRYRIDGVLQHRHSPPKNYQAQLLTRIKVMAKLDIAQHRLPQDGRIKLRMAGRHIDFRVSTVPCQYGERIVLRILDKGNVALGINQIGMDEDIEKAFRSLLKQNQGILLVTGPTGSGKTTTLYSGIAEVAGEEINVMTIEDPVEYKLDNIAQISVNPKIDLTFAKGLRHILRQDPDVIMIGEIRDKETAEIAIQSSLTGHLVLSTLHTNDAPSALTRLVDMGIEPYLLSSSVLGVLAQRLVRRICPHCKKSYKPSSQELRDIGLEKTDLIKGILFKGKGCSLCFGTGYKGRVGVYELMTLNHSIKQQLMRNADASALQTHAIKSGMRSLREGGAFLCIKGVTTSSEVLRVTRETQVEEYV